jgi:hypothetical protein
MLIYQFFRPDRPSLLLFGSFLSVISGDDFSVFTDTNSTTMVGNTKLDGPAGGTGTNTCALVYDASFTFYLGTCP